MKRVPHSCPILRSSTRMTPLASDNIQFICSSSLQVTHNRYFFVSCLSSLNYRSLKTSCLRRQRRFMTSKRVLLSRENNFMTRIEPISCNKQKWGASPINDTTLDERERENAFGASRVRKRDSPNNTSILDSLNIKHFKIYLTDRMSDFGCFLIFF